MLAEERRKKIVQILTRKGSIAVNELSELLGVVPITIRRDLEALEKEKGIIIRTHGGAILQGEPFLHQSLTAKETQNQDAKARIAEKAATLVNDGEIIILDEGSTCLELAKELKNNKNITVVTNGIKVAMELTPCANITTLLVGGVCGHQNYVAYGHETVEAFNRIRAHKYFMGIDALVPSYGISDGDLHQVQLKLAKAASSQKVIGIADNTKLGKIALAYVGPLSMMDCLIMNSPVTEVFRQALSNEQVELVEVN
jgi:DeoR/GlpR family transcriptional regulator of sugar metabolism